MAGDGPIANAIEYITHYRYDAIPSGPSRLNPNEWGIESVIIAILTPNRASHALEAAPA